jgi:catechol 2,3-dioxygenase-like lactoylglutathione lyase family enzyme
MLDDARTRPATPLRTKLLIAMLALGVAAVALCLNRALNGDLYLLLFSGRFIAHHGPVGYDPFPTIEHGQSWLNQQWLSEVGFYGTERVVGLTGITILYAVLLGIPLALLLGAIRRKGTIPMLFVAALYLPGILAIIHPRAAGLTLLLFSVMAVLVLAGMRLDSAAAGRPSPPLWMLAAIPLLFGLWANLHGGFIAGLLLVGLVTVGLAVDRWRGQTSVSRARIALLAGAGVLGAIAATFATPLGVDICSYILSFRNPALKLASTEWEPVTNSIPAIAFVVAGAALAAWTWRLAPSPRRVMPVLVAAGFLVFAASSMRNLIFVAPALAFQIACSLPDRLEAPNRIVVGLAVSGAAAAVLLYAAVLGPPNADRVGNPAVQYAIQHPPKRGRIVAYAGPSSYMLWRAPETPVAIDGWLEHFTEAELRANFGILHGSLADPTPYVRRLHAGAAIAYIPEAIDRLRAHGFVAKVSGPNGTYLVRRGGARP